MTLEQRIEQAHAHIESNEWPEATAIAQAMIAEEEADGYELMATILATQEEFEQAVVLLEQAVEQFPGNWIFWMRLGNYQSDLGEFEAASYALDRAEYINGADQALVRLNKVIMFTREDKYAEAEALLELIRPVYPVRALAAHMMLAQEQEDFEAIIDAFDEFEFPDEDELEDGIVSQVYFHLAMAFWHIEEAALAQDSLSLSLHWDRANPNALWLRREMQGEIHPENTCFQIMIQGDWFEETENGEGFQFLSSYQVAALDLDSALEMIKDFEPVPLDVETFKLVEYEEVSFDKQSPSGIYWVTGFYTFVEE